MTTLETPRSRTGFATILAVAMAASTFSLAVPPVLAAQLLDEFALDRWQLGLVVTSIAVVGAVASPIAGQASDRIGGRRSLLVTFGGSAVCLAAIALAPAYPWLLVAGVVAGLAQAASNPATNKLISIHVDGGTRGLVTGVKQSGVQVGIALAGVLLPLGATVFGWRIAVLLAAAIPTAGLIVTPWLVPVDHPAKTQPGGQLSPSMARDPFVLWLALYGFLLGAGWSGVFTYLPDYAHQAVGFSIPRAGALVTVAGVLGVAGRIGWSWLAERRFDAPRILTLLAGLAVVSAVALTIANTQPILLWAAAGLLGLSAGAWNAVGMLAVIEALPHGSTGRGSGTVLFGFLTGLAVGAPLFGWSVDITAAYATGLIGSAVIFLAGAAAAAKLVALARGETEAGEQSG